MLAGATASALVVGLLASGAGVGSHAQAATADPPPPVLRVGSFNVKSIHHDPKARGAQKTWAERRGAVIADILGERSDVVGVQETHQSYNYADKLKDGRNQYLDLRNGLNKAGGTYELTNAVPHNCVREWTISKCEYQYRGASRNTRILYNTRTVTMLSEGSTSTRSRAEGPTTPGTSPGRSSGTTPPARSSSSATPTWSTRTGASRRRSGASSSPRSSSSRATCRWWSWVTSSAPAPSTPQRR